MFCWNNTFSCPGPGPGRSISYPCGGGSSGTSPGAFFPLGALVFVFTVVLLCICMFKSALGMCGTSQGTFIPLSAPVPYVDTMVGIIGHPTIGHPGTFRNHAIIDRRPSLLIW